MRIKKIVWALCLAALMPVSSTAFAVALPDEPQQEKQTPVKEIPNPEKTARRLTDEMDKVLNLTEKQYKKIYKLNLKEEREKLEALIGRGDKEAGRQPFVGANIVHCTGMVFVVRLKFSKILSYSAIMNDEPSVSMFMYSPLFLLCDGSKS